MILNWLPLRYSYKADIWKHIEKEYVSWNNKENMEYICICVHDCILGRKKDDIDVGMSVILNSC